MKKLIQKLVSLGIQSSMLKTSPKGVIIPWNVAMTFDVHSKIQELQPLVPLGFNIFECKEEAEYLLQHSKSELKDIPFRSGIGIFKGKDAFAHLVELDSQD